MTDNIKEQISKLSGALQIQEKYFAPLQQFTQGVMYTTHGMEMKLSYSLDSLWYFRPQEGTQVCVTGTPLCMQSLASTHFGAHWVFLLPVN